MVRQLRSFAGGLPAAGVLAALMAGTPTPAAAQMDPITVAVVDSTPTAVTLHVTAGPSGAPGGFYIEWMYKADYDATGWPSDPYDPTLFYCEFLTMPSWNTGGASGYQLGPNESIDVVVGDLFDETGLTTDYLSELAPNQSLIARGFTEAFGAVPPSDRTPGLLCGTPPPPDCHHSFGWWKDHSSSWATSSLTLGSVVYSKTQLMSILNKQAGTNGLISLAHQLIATRLNILDGANSAGIQPAINTANSLIGSRVCPPIGAGSLSPNSCNPTAHSLQDDNEGSHGRTSCTVTPARHVTWGAVKSIYR